MRSSAASRPASHRWQRTLYIMSFAQMVTAVGFSSIFPFLPLYVKSLGASSFLSIELLAGLVFSAQAATMMIASPIWGALADRWGRKLMVERSLFGGTLTIALMAFVRSAEELVLLRALQGMITGTIGAANALVASLVPRERIGYAMGMLQVAMGFGVGIGPVIGGLVADAYGYRAAFYVTAALLAVAGVIVHFGVKEHFTAPKPDTTRPTGLLNDWRHVLLAPGVAMTFSLRFMNQLGRMVFIPILPLFIHSLVANAERVNSLTGVVIGVSSAATAVFAVILGRLGDRIGYRRILIVSSMGCAIFFLMQSRVTTICQLLILQTLYGMATGGIVPEISALLIHYTQPGEEGAVYGLDNSIVAGARAVAPMLGVAVAMWLGFRAVFVSGAVLYLAAAILAGLGLPKGKENGPGGDNLRALSQVIKPDNPLQ